MSDRELRRGARYVVHHTTRDARAVVDGIDDRIDNHTFDRQSSDSLGLNDIGRIRIRLSQPLVVDPYAANRTTGSFILVDEATNDTVGAGMVVAADPDR